MSTVKLFSAIRQGDLVRVNTLLEKGAYLHTTADGGPKGWRAAQLAAAEGQLKALQMIGEKNKALLIEADSEGDTPAHLAAFYGHAPCLQFLLQTATAEVLSAKNNAGRTPDHVAAG